MALANAEETRGWTPLECGGTKWPQKGPFPWSRALRRTGGQGLGLTERSAAQSHISGHSCSEEYVKR